MKLIKLASICLVLIMSINIKCHYKTIKKETITVSIESLLNEMIDRDQLARFPSSNYRCLQASSYNRESVSPDLPGWFADSDGVSCIRTEKINGKTEWVLMEDDGPGCITHVWAVCFYYGLNDTIGANIKFYLDGATEPVINTNFFQLVKGNDFIPSPFADETTRAGNLYFPIPYAKSCKITMDRKVFYNIINYRKYPQGTPVKTFTITDFNNVKKLYNKVGEELLTCSPAKGIDIEKGKIIHKRKELIIHLPEGSNAVRQIEIKIKNKENIANLLRNVVLVGEFDQKETVWVPVGDFFSNVGKQRAYKMWERSVNEDGTMICRWVMPYKSSGKISLVNLGETDAEVNLKVTTTKWEWDASSMHFYATWRMDEPHSTFPIFDWNFLEAEGKGVIVGDMMCVLNPAQGWWGEGDEKIYVDDDLKRNFPSHFGTGTEDYYGWAGGVVPTPDDEFSKPFLGNIIVGENNSEGYNVCTRTRVLDAIPFGQKIKFDVEASCGSYRTKWFMLQYTQVTFWYAIPGVKHNRNILTNMASKPLPTLENLQEKVNEARKEQFIVDRAIEAELYKITSKSNSVYEKNEKIDVWGEISNGDIKKLIFEKENDYAEFTVTEQFEKSHIELCALMSPNSGEFDIFVNGLKKATVNLATKHSGMTTPLVNLGENEPVNNEFTFRFVLKNTSNKQTLLGIDYLLIKNNFMNPNNID